MRGRQLFVPLLIFSLIALRALACASPPDPLWVPGVYDGADSDDVITAFGCLDAHPDDPLPALSRPERLLAGVAVPAREGGRCISRSVPSSRAPPTR